MEDDRRRRRDRPPASRRLFEAVADHVDGDRTAALPGAATAAIR
jgi:hypothetical protein